MCKGADCKTCAEGDIYTWSTQLHAIKRGDDSDNGQIKWSRLISTRSESTFYAQYPNPGVRSMPPAVAPNKGGGDRAIFIRSTTCTSGMSCSDNIEGSTLHAINPLNGEDMWTTEYDHMQDNRSRVSASDPAVAADGSTIIILEGEIVWDSTNRLIENLQVVGLDPNDGTEKWRSTEALRHSACPQSFAISGSAQGFKHALGRSLTIDSETASVYVGSSKSDRETCNGGFIDAFSTTDGVKKWSYEIPSGKSSAAPHPAIGPDGTLALGGMGLKDILSIDHTTGQQKWSFRLEDETFYQVAFGPDGTLYSRTPKISNSGFNFVALRTTASICTVEEVDGVIFSPPVYPTSCRSAAAEKAVQDECQEGGRTFEQDCAASFKADFMEPNFEAMQTEYCKAFQNHPPYSCSRQVRRELLESISLSFGFAELVYLGVLFLMAQGLWHFYHDDDASAKSGSQARRARRKPAENQAVPPANNDVVLRLNMNPSFDGV